MKRLLTFTLALLMISGTMATAQEVQCIKEGLDGTVTLLSWGVGKDKKAATRDAEKTAIDAILFTGVTKGVQSRAVKPLITSVNARENNEDFFDKFFKEKGKYRKYVEVTQTRSMKKVKHNSYSEYECCIALKILLPKLKNRMEKDGLIK